MPQTLQRHVNLVGCNFFISSELGVLGIRWFLFVAGEDDCRTGYFFYCGYEGAILSVIIQISCKEIFN